MTENKEFNQENNILTTNEAQAATTPQTKPIFVKFNKEVKALSIEEASLLAQKGMKFDLIEKDFKLLKNLANKVEKSVSGFLEDLKQKAFEQRKKELLEKCSGDTDLVDKIMMLESGNCGEEPCGFTELKTAFPSIKSIEQLPAKVIEASRLKGTLLLDEYLRYRLEQKSEAGKRMKAQENAEKLSLGSQLNRKNVANRETEEFIKGLWN